MPRGNARIGRSLPSKVPRLRNLYLLPESPDLISLEKLNKPKSRNRRVAQWVDPTGMYLLIIYDSDSFTIIYDVNK